MTQKYLGQIPDPSQESGNDLAARLNAFDNAHRTNQSGPTRPASILPGGLWTRIVAGVTDLMVFDGAQDRVVMRGDDNLAGLSNPEAARGNLGLGGLATKGKIDNRDWEGNVLTVANGGTSANNAASARTNLGFSISNAARATLNDAESHTNAQWLAGTSTSPGFPSPAQLAAVVSANIPTPAVPPRWRRFTTEERNPNTWHTNNTGAPLEFLLVNQGSDAFLMYGRRNSTTPQAMIGYANSGTGGAAAMAGGIIPPGWQYRFNTGGNVQVDEYWEKR